MSVAAPQASIPAAQPQPGPPLLVVRGLTVEFATAEGWIPVVENLSFSIKSREAVGLVGESGSGKSVSSLSILQLLPRRDARIAAGSIRFNGRELVGLGTGELNRIRGRDIGMIFQEPMTSLNPVFTVGEQIAESARIHLGLSARAAWQRAVEMLDLVQIPSAARRASDYPHAFSGGMRQRVMIAMAMVCGPTLLVADEPTTALDVTIQAGILSLLTELKETLGLSILFVTHDLGVVSQFCDRLMVMYAGQIVEEGLPGVVFARPRHPYSEGLLRSIPYLGDASGKLWSIPGVVPPANAFPLGCRFHPRCAYAVDGLCNIDVPALEQIDDTRAVRCKRAEALHLSGVEE